ncbi:TPA: HAD-IA family hydrolase [Photobacterium damselae]
MQQLRLENSQNGIKALSFDLDDTLYDNREVIVRAEQAMHQWLAEFDERFLLFRDGFWPQLKRRLALADPWLKHDVTLWRYQSIKVALMQLGYREAAAALAADRAVEHVLTVRNQVDVPPLTHQVLTQLSAHFPLVAITNGNVDIDKIGLGTYFQHRFCAGPDGLAKPDSNLFDKAVHALQVAPEQILHVGDHPISDIQGAQQAGFKTCWFNDKGRDFRALSSDMKPDIEIHQLDELLPLVTMNSVTESIK